MNMTLITLIRGILLGAVRVFFWWRGSDDAKKEIELEQKTEVLDEIEKKRKRDVIVDSSSGIRDSLSKHYNTADKN